MRTLLAVTTLLVLTATTAHARSLQLERLESDIQVRQDGAVVVQETLHVRFNGSWNGIFRVIPYGLDMGWWKSLRKLTVIGITDGGGNDLKFWEERERGKVKLKIRVPSARDATRIVKIQYELKHVIYGAGDKDEAEYGGKDILIWNATGDAWEMPLQSVEVRVRLPEEIKPEDVQTVAYTGRHGGKARDYEHVKSPDGIHIFRTTRTLMPGENLTVRLIFPPGVVARPSSVALAWYFLQANWPVLLPLLLVLSWFLFWWFRGRDPLERTVIAEFEAPFDLRPSEVGTLIDDRMDPRDLSAAFVDLAVRGIITIEGAKKKKQTAFVVHPKVRDSAEMATWERTLLKKVFKGGEERVTLAALRKRFPQSSDTVRDGLLDHLVERKMYPKRPDKIYGHWLGMTLLMVILLVIVGITTRAAPIYWVALPIAAIIMFLIARAMPRRTKHGLDALARIQGLEDYLQTAEKERMQEMPLDKLEKLLPYAVALGVHERWAEHMSGLYEGNQPQWYRGPSQGWLWVDGLDSLNSGVRSNMVPVSRVSSSSTGKGGWGSSWGGGTFSGGGGFSGGGFGGGGGGGW